MSAGDDAQATFRIALEDATSGPAASSAAALDSLKGKIEADTNALKGLQLALRNLKGGGVAADSAVKGLKDRIAAQKATIAGTQAGILQLGGGMTKLKASTVAADGGLKGLGQAFAAIAAAQKASPKGQAIEALREHVTGALGPLGRFVPMLKGASAGSLALAAASVAVAAALVAVTAAVVGGIAALLRYGIAVADARRNELLRLEGLAKIRNFWSGFSATQKNAAATASFLQSQIDRVSGSVAIGRDQVAGYAEQLFRMGLRGRNLQDALEGVAITAAVQGDAQAQAFAGWAAGANLTGQSVRALANDVKARLGGIAARQMLSLEVLSKKLHESFGMIFSGLKLDKLAAGVSKITELFSQSSASGRALKAIVEALFQPMIDGAGETAPIIKRFFQGIIIGALYVAIGIVKVRNWFRDTFGQSTVDRIDKTRVALALGAFVVFSLAAAVGLLAVAVGLLLLPLFLLGAAFVAVIDGGIKLYNWIESVDWKALGISMIDGLVNGLVSASSRVWEAMKNVARGAVKAFKDTMGMHSPSRVMFGAGFFTGAGTALGIHASRPLVRNASHAMARDVQESSQPMYEGIGTYARSEATAAAPKAQGGGEASGQRNTFTFGDINLQGGSGDAKAQAQSFRQALEEALMGVSVHLGARA
jgi:hypothetical protein